MPYRSDLEAAHERIAALEAEVVKLHKPTLWERIKAWWKSSKKGTINLPHDGRNGSGYMPAYRCPKCGEDSLQGGGYKCYNSECDYSVRPSKRRIAPQLEPPTKPKLPDPPPVEYIKESDVSSYATKLNNELIGEDTIPPGIDYSHHELPFGITMRRNGRID